jgi:hypothetical protein
MFYWRGLCLFSLSMALLVPDSFGEEPLRGRGEVNWRLGSERSILTNELWAPILQDESRGDVLYGDLRLMGDDQDNREFNLGLGYRRIASIPVLGDGVAGMHGWFDRRLTERGSAFHQSTLGVEWLGERFDARLNGYIPLSEEQTHSTPNIGKANPYLAGSGIFFDTNGEILEEPQGGFDIELGWEIGQSFEFTEKHTDSLRIYGGAYHFEGDRTEDVTGWRARLTSDITPNISLGGRFQKDDVRGSQGFLEATIRFPFDAKKSFRKEGVRARLDESPERDIDIVSGAVVTDTGLAKPVLNAQTGAAQRVIYVDNQAAAGGTGSKENPFNTLAAAQAVLADHDIVYVAAGDGTTAGQNTGFTINKANVSLIGSGVNFVYDGSRFRAESGTDYTGSLLAAASAAPVITNTNPGSDGITIAADEVAVSGVSVNGATRHGIYALASGGAQRAGVQISDVTVNSNAGSGIVVETRNAGSRIESVELRDITASGNNERGVLIYAHNNGQVVNAELRDIAASGNRWQGVFVQSFNGGLITNAALNNITSNNNNNVTGIGRGVEIRSEGAGSRIESAELNNIGATGNRLQGVIIYGFNGGLIESVELNDIAASTNNDRGVYILAQSG